MSIGGLPQRPVERHICPMVQHVSEDVQDPVVVAETSVILTVFESPSPKAALTIVRNAVIPVRRSTYAVVALRGAVAAQTSGPDDAETPVGDADGFRVLGPARAARVGVLVVTDGILVAAHVRREGAGAGCCAHDLSVPFALSLSNPIRTQSWKKGHKRLALTSVGDTDRVRHGDHDGRDTHAARTLVGAAALVIVLAGTKARRAFWRRGGLADRSVAGKVEIAAGQGADHADSCDVGR